MHIGLDFDNTLIDYDGVFHGVAVEQSLIPADLPATKLAVRDYLRQQQREDVWTELQGYVYGQRLLDCPPYAGILEYLSWTRTRGLRTLIVSHKTRYPYLGPRYDLQSAARNWIGTVLRDAHGPLVLEENVFFHETKAEKIARIGSESCDVFVDDLPEILLDPAFPARTRAILFDPQGQHPQPTAAFAVLRSWQDKGALEALFECRI